MCRTHVHVALHLSNEYSDIGSSFPLNLAFSIRRVDLKNANFSGTSTEVIFIHCFKVKIVIILEVLVFVEGGIPEKLEKNPWTRDEKRISNWAH